jgi:L-ascorbate metabolism protein UlaG (beta-lactamase superfamily)
MLRKGGAIMAKGLVWRIHRLSVAVCVLLVFVSVACCWGGSSSSPTQAAGQTEVEQMVSNIHWLGHASFRIEGDGLVIYIDPWMIERGPKADLILITHDHRDHCSPDDVSKIRKEDSTIVTVAAAAAKLSGTIQEVIPGDELTVKGIAIEAVPAYNVNKFRSPGVPFHPKESGYVGFVLKVEGKRIYHAGDTDVIPEMGSIDADIALLPVSGTYVMTADEAVEAAKTIKPRIAIPMHVGRGIGSMSDTKDFKENATVPVEILPMEK